MASRTTPRRAAGAALPSCLRVVVAAAALPSFLRAAVAEVGLWALVVVVGLWVLVAVVGLWAVAAGVATWWPLVVVVVAGFLFLVAAPAMPMRLVGRQGLVAGTDGGQS